MFQNEVGAEKTEIEKSHQSAEDKISQLQAHKMVVYTNTVSWI